MKEPVARFLSFYFSLPSILTKKKILSFPKSQNVKQKNETQVKTTGQLPPKNLTN